MNGRWCVVCCLIRTAANTAAPLTGSVCLNNANANANAVRRARHQFNHGLNTFGPIHSDCSLCLDLGPTNVTGESAHRPQHAMAFPLSYHLGLV